MPEKRQRLVWADCLKGFVMLCVVLGHVAYGYEESGLYQSQKDLLWTVMLGVGTFHMPAFYLISGYMFSLAYVPGGALRGGRLREQALNLAGIYVLYSLAMGAGKVVLSAFANTQMRWSDLLMIWAKTIPPYWYIYVLLFFYGALSLRRVRAMRSGAVFAVLFALSYVVHEGYLRLTDWFEIERVARYAVFFYAGYAIQQRGGLTKRQSTAALVVGGAVALAQAVQLYLRRHLPSDSPLQSPYALVISIFLLEAFRRSRTLGGSALLALIGRHCLEIFVLHCFFTSSLRPVLTRLGVKSAGLSMALNMSVSTFASLGLALLIRRMGLFAPAFRPYTALKSFFSHFGRKGC